MCLLVKTTPIKKISYSDHCHSTATFDGVTMPNECTSASN